MANTSSNTEGQVKEVGEPVFEVTPNGFVWHKKNQEGIQKVSLTNWTAQIEGDIVEDNGVETHRTFEIEAQLNESVSRFTLSASEFEVMRWPTTYLGAGAITYSNQAYSNQVKVAIQLNSPQIIQHHIYTHTGWRQLESGAWVYLHANGAIGTDGTVSGVRVHLPESLSKYQLPDPPPTGVDLQKAILASLQFLEVAPLSVTIPLYAAICRAALGQTQFSLHASGKTGTFKSSLAALVQQHFGKEMDFSHLPGSWSSTPNALEILCFHSKDTIIVVDDFIPTGSNADIQRYHANADRLLRGQGNQAGRQRLTSDSQLMPPKPPRGLILSTGEDTPTGHSLRARLLEVEVEPSMVRKDRLSRCQEHAKQGLYAQAMAGYIQWLATQYESIQHQLGDKISECRTQFTKQGMHARTPDILANLMVGLEYFLTFAREQKVLSVSQVEEWRKKAIEALKIIGKGQQQGHQETDPVQQVFDQLDLALSSGQAHLCSLPGTTPPFPREWGWKEFGSENWQPQGTKLGWIDSAKQALYLDPMRLVPVAQQQARKQGETLSFTDQTIKKRLKDDKFIQTDRDRLTVRRTVEGQRREVLCLTPAAPLSQKLRQLCQPCTKSAPKKRASKKALRA